MYASPSNNYGSSITAKPYGGAIARSLTSRSFTPVTGNRSRDAMSRAMFDQNRNATEASRENFENQFQTSFQQARANDVMALRRNQLGDYRLSQKKQIDDAARAMQESQGMRSLASRLTSQKNAEKWGAMMDYTRTFLRPEFIGMGKGQEGLLPYLYGQMGPSLVTQDPMFSGGDFPATSIGATLRS